MTCPKNARSDRGDPLPNQSLSPIKYATQRAFCVQFAPSAALQWAINASRSLCGIAACAGKLHKEKPTAKRNQNTDVIRPLKPLPAATWLLPVLPRAAAEGDLPAIADSGERQMWVDSSMIQCPFERGMATEEKVYHVCVVLPYHE